MEEQQLQQAIAGKDKHYSDKKFLTKIQRVGGKLGKEAMQAAATLFVALKSPDMPKSSKMIVLGALGYFILPVDVITDFLPLVGLTDDVAVIMLALGKVYLSITDEMKEEAATLTEKWTGKESILTEDE
ncbi:MAG: YkvA family protein [Solibacillus sp.]